MDEPLSAGRCPYCKTKLRARTLKGRISEWHRHVRSCKKLRQMREHESGMGRRLDERRARKRAAPRRAAAKRDTYNVALWVMGRQRPLVRRSDDTDS